MAVVTPLRWAPRYDDPRCGEAVAALRASVDAVVEADPAEATDEELVEALVALHRERQRLEAAAARMAAVWDARLAWAGDGARSGAAWMAERCRVPRSEAGAHLHLARAVRELPAVEGAWAAGEINTCHARRLARAARRAPDLFARDEPVLVEHARTLRFPEFLRAVAYWEQRADAEGVEADVERA